MSIACTNLSHRELRPEVMDRPGLDRSAHHGALRGLRRLNVASCICHQLCQEIMAFSHSRRMQHLTVLDVASGGGDVSFGLWKLARRRGLSLRILGLDVSVAACQYATEQCRAAAGEIVFEQSDVKHDELSTGFDVVICSLFLHHLTRVEASALLKKMAAAGRLMLASDLRRSIAGYALAQLACHVLTRSAVVRYDGPQSVANAFTIAEMGELCLAAGIKDASVRRAWPCRMLIRHESPP